MSALRFGLLLAMVIGLHASGVAAQSARELMEGSLRRHVLPAHVYQEQTLVVTDSQRKHTVRTARFYGRSDPSGARRLLVIESPADLRGASVFVERDAQGARRRGPEASSAVFGMDFSVADFEDEQLRSFEYAAEDSQDLDRESHHVVRATPKDEGVSRDTGYGVRRIFLRKDNLFVTRIDFLDRQGRLAKRRTFRDPRPDESGAWRAGMILTEDLREDRRTLIKIERRVHSADYVPEAVFAGFR